MKNIVLVIASLLLLASCGVKNDLIRPNGKPAPKDQPDPSKPPIPIGR